MIQDRENINSTPEHGESSPQASSEVAPLLNVTTEMVEGKVNEIAPTGSEKSTQQTSGQGSQTQTQKQDDQALTDRELLRERLLKQAPAPKVMKAQVQRVLEEEKIKLEVDIKKYRRKRQYHHMSIALMKLRRVVHQLEELARTGIEQLKEMWLKVVHKFA